MISRFLLAVAALILLTHCNDSVEVEREVGYRGKARVNPFLAFERYVKQAWDEEVIVRQTWQELDANQGFLLIPSDLLASELSINQVRRWVASGGHAVFLFDHADMQRNEWSEFGSNPEVPQALKKMMEDMDLGVENSYAENSISEAKIFDETYKVSLKSRVKLLDEKKVQQAVISREWGDGMMTFVSDARLLRNRTIDQEQHIELIDQLLEWRRDGEIIFMRGVGISFFGLLWQKGWMVLVALAVVIGAWLLRHMPRFGPMQSGLREDQIRAYDHHLEMIGDFHWRLDRGASLLQPLRNEVQELCHHWQSRNGHLDDRLFDVMALRASIPAERVERAMTELQPRDQLIFTRTVADLQNIRKAFA